MAVAGPDKLYEWLIQPRIHIVEGGVYGKRLGQNPPTGCYAQKCEQTNPREANRRVA